ncbi:MAG TPA: hypothetical protein RMH99_06565 [Sandaracinaceae bacterium LLY-WYZ-13_1]|nr:hypothetical protein [Sandaracinaceae bacterium LLY-WYZ-13_1]
MRVTSIVREDEGGQSRVVADVYKVEYRDLLLAAYRDESPLATIARVMWALPPAALRWLMALRSPLMSGKEKFQVLLALAMLSVVGLYLVLLGAAIVSTGRELASTQAAERRDASVVVDVEEPLETAGRYVETHLGDIVTFLALLLPTLGLGVPARAEIRQRLVESAALVTALILYFQAGAARPRLAGRLHGVLEGIHELDGVSYRRTHIVGYSFGSIVALDSLFPAGPELSPRLNRVDWLVTIGSPFDFVQLFWPRYFASRVAPEGLRWLNIYAVSDVLSSNFRGFSKVRELGSNERAESSQTCAPLPAWVKAPESVRYAIRMGEDGFSLYDALMLRGLRNHTLYWESEDGPQVNVFDQVVARVYRDDAVLR